MLTVTEISQRMEERFALLRSRIRSADQRTLFDALSWSWDLLSPWGQAALSQCTVFQGGFELSEAEKVRA